MLKKERITGFFNRIGWMTSEQKKEHAHFSKQNNALDEWASQITEAYKKYNNGEGLTIEGTPLSANSDAFKKHILEELDKFKQKIQDVFGEEGIPFYLANSKSGQIEKHTHKSWSGSAWLDASNRTTMTDLIGIDHILRTGEKPHPDFEFGWKGGETSDQMREYYKQLTF